MKRRDPTFALFLAILFLGGCGDSQPDNPNGEIGTVTYGRSTANLNWLGAENRTDPALWLAEKEASAISPASPEAVARIQKALIDANNRFLETPRMLANRTAQLSDMLARDGQKENYIDLIESFSKVAEGSKGKLEYGDLCQFYFNLRHKGIDKAAAFALLGDKYQALIRKP